MGAPSYREFVAMSRRFNLIPVYTAHPGENENPVSLYARIKSKAAGHSFLLESVEGNKSSKRYSFIGYDPFLTFQSKNNTGEICSDNGQRDTKYGPPTMILSELLKNYKVPEFRELPPFYGGAAGYFSYDVIRSLEKLPGLQQDTLNLPDCLLIFPRNIIIFDHAKGLIYYITLVQPGSDPENDYSRALARLQEMTNITGRAEPVYNSVTPGINPETVRTNISIDKYFQNVNNTLRYIKEGDILQAVLSRRYSVPFNGDALEIFRRLRHINPSPYMFYLDFGDPIVLGASPEMLVRVKDNEAETRPIAGTRPRYRDFLRDREMEKELARDEKERAEHLMLVDLGRNDLGRVCSPGSIEVPEFMQVERFSHVMHLVSRVRGKVGKDVTPVQVLEACFPAGTVSGAPKVRAMEIIDELETDRRGVYAGAVGYIGFNGNLDTAISIRTMVITGGEAHIQAGGGIVSDSEPEKEYRETVKKAGSLLQALGLEETGGVHDGASDR